MSLTTSFESGRLIDTFSGGQRDVLESIASGAPLPEVLAQIVRLVEHQSEGMICSIVLLDRNKQCLRSGAAPSLPEEYNRSIEGLPIGPEMGSCEAAAYLGERVIVEDTATHPNWAIVRDLALRCDLRACWSNPIFAPTREVLGTFAMYYRETRGPHPREIEWVEAATHLASVALCREAADRALHLSEERYRQMVDTAYEGVWLIDAEGRTTFVNQRLGEMLGYPPEEMLGKSMFDFMDDAGRAEAAVNFDRRKIGVREQHEFRFTRKDGTDLWTIVAASPVLDEQGGMTSALGMITDITKRKVAEAALRQSEDEFRAIFENAALGVALVDREGRLQKTNPALDQLLAYASGELLGSSLAKLTYPGDRDESLFAELLDGTRNSYRHETRYLRKDGRIVWVRVTASAVRAADGRFRFAIAMIEDETLRHEAEENHTRLESQLRQSQKMQSLGTLAGGIAHDFNNILAAIGGNAELAMADLPADHAAQHSLAEIEIASDRAASLVRQILSFSRPQESNRKVVKLRAVIEEALRLLRASVPATVVIHTDFAEETPDIAADSTQIHQVIMNLGANAAHAMGDRGGMLELRLKPVFVGTDQRRATIELPAGRYAELTVRDNGSGMEPDTAERIFEPFFTTKPPGQGTGLGLSMVHGIVRGHGGSIAVESEPERGTTFHLLFPSAEGAPGDVSSTRAGALRGNGERVLYVDDESGLILLARRGLEKLGYAIAPFTDARAALQAFRNRPGDFDIVVTDLAMPGLTGLDLAEAILRIRSTIPVILTTGYLRPTDAQRAERLGLRNILPKPASLDTLARMLQSALDQSR